MAVNWALLKRDKTGHEISTSLPVNVPIQTNGTDPATLILPYRFKSGNTPLHEKLVMPVGPQTDGLRTRHNDGRSLLTGIRPWLSIAGQHPDGLQPRYQASFPNESWDSPWIVNQSIEVV